MVTNIFTILILTTFVHIIDSFYSSKYLCRAIRSHSVLSSTLISSDIEKLAVKSNEFDFKLALLLTGFSFESYNEKMTGKKAIGLDNTIVTFTSADFIRDVFAGVLLVTLKQAKLNFEETQLTERLLSGNEADSYVIIHIENDDLNNIRVIDSWTSTTKPNQNAPIWNESGFLYIRNPTQSYITFSIMDKDILKSDDVIGTGFIKLTDLYPSALSESTRTSSSDSSSSSTSNNNNNNKGEKGDNNNSDKNKKNKKNGIELNIPIYDKNYNYRNSWNPFFKQEKWLRKGNIGVNLQYIPFEQSIPSTSTSNIPSTSTSTTSTINDSTSTSSATATTAAAADSEITSTSISSLSNRFPKGATDHLNWATLLDTLHTATTTTTTTTTTINSGDTTSSRSNDGNNGDSRDMSGEKKDKYTLGNKLLNSLIPDKSNNLIVNHQESKLRQHQRQHQRDIQGLHQICTIDNTETDTQASVWADFYTKQLVIAFRGTEQIKFKDILTDINLLQTPYEESHPILNQLLVHQGFLTAFRSVRSSLLQLLHTIFHITSTTNTTTTTNANTNASDPHQSKNSDGNILENTGNFSSSSSWSIYITGHSLGGALATLMSFELGRMKQGIFSPIASPDSPIKTIDKRLFYNYSATLDAITTHTDIASYYQYDTDFLTALQSANIVTYTIGAPRVGDPNFVRVYNDVASHTYRIVNNLDIVARLPRSSSTNRLLQYEHVGRAVLVNDTTKGLLWIQPTPSSKLYTPIPISLTSSNTTSSSGFNLIEMSSFTVDPNVALETVSKEIINFMTSTMSTINNNNNNNEDITMKNNPNQLWAQFGNIANIANETFSSFTKSTNTNIDMFMKNMVSTLPGTITLGKDININISDTMYGLMNSLNDNMNQVMKNTGLDIQSLQDIVQESFYTVPDMINTTLTQVLSNVTVPSTLVTKPIDVTVPSINTNIINDISSFSSSFIDKEIKILRSILDGSALIHHLEPSYYSALEQVIVKSILPSLMNESSSTSSSSSPSSSSSNSSPPSTS